MIGVPHHQEQATEQEQQMVKTRSAKSLAKAVLNGVTDCEVLVVEPCRRLSYSWNASGEEAANGLKTVVTWTLTPTATGTLVRMEQSGFRAEDESFYRGAGYGWQKMIAALEQVAASAS